MVPWGELSGPNVILRHPRPFPDIRIRNVRNPTFESYLPDHIRRLGPKAIALEKRFHEATKRVRALDWKRETEANAAKKRGVSQKSESEYSSDSSDSSSSLE